MQTKRSEGKKGMIKFMEEENEKRNEPEYITKRDRNGKKLVLIILVIVGVLIISPILWYNFSLSGTGTSDEKVSVEIGLENGRRKK